MKKVRIYLKSGRKITIRCKEFNFTFDKNTNERSLEMSGFANGTDWMIDLTEIECFIVSKCYFNFF